MLGQWWSVWLFLQLINPFHLELQRRKPVRRIWWAATNGAFWRSFPSIEKPFKFRCDLYLNVTILASVINSGIENAVRISLNVPDCCFLPKTGALSICSNPSLSPQKRCSQTAPTSNRESATITWWKWISQLSCAPLQNDWKLSKTCRIRDNEKIHHLETQRETLYCILLCTIYSPLTTLSQTGPMTSLHSQPFNVICFQLFSLAFECAIFIRAEEQLLKHKGRILHAPSFKDLCSNNVFAVYFRHINYTNFSIIFQNFEIHRAHPQVLLCPPAILKLW